MTIKEAFAQGIYQVRLPQWNDQAHLDMRVVNGKLAPILKLYDVGVNGVPVLAELCTEETYEPWTAPNGHSPDIHNPLV